MFPCPIGSRIIGGLSDNTEAPVSTNLSDTIKADLATHLQTGEPLPCALNLKALAAHYGVSPMPVRQAVEGLLNEGLLRREGNGRLHSVATPPKARRRKSTAAPKAPSSEPSSDTEAALRETVIQRCLMQNTDYLREQATASALGIGRTVMRQLFARLAGEGLITHVPRCGWQVKPFSESAMLEYLQVREVLELQALDLARPQFKEAELRALLQANQPGRKNCLPKLTLDLHDYWIERCGNAYIQDFFTRHGPFYNALFNYAVVDDKTKGDMAKEHSDILNCLLKKDWSGARSALGLHIRDQQAAVVEAVLRLEVKASRSRSSVS